MTTAASLAHRAWAASFGDDAAFLKSHTELIVLSDAKGQAKVAVAPAWQGRVMTSTAGDDAGLSFGWINRELIASGKTQPHMNAVRRRGPLLDGAGGRPVLDLLRQGGEVRVRGLVHARGHSTRCRSRWSASPGPRPGLRAEFALTNYSGTRFDVAVNREVRLLDTGAGLEEARGEAGRRREPGRLRDGQQDHQRRQGRLEEGHRPALHLDSRHVQPVAFHHHRGAHQGRAGVRTRREGDLGLLRPACRRTGWW